MIVSVVVPTIGRPELREAIISVAKQDTNVALETLIVLDDPAKEEFVTTLGEQYGARVLCSAGKRGGAECRNIGMEESTGDYIAFLDDDDLWHPAKLRIQLAATKDQSNGVEKILSATALEIRRRNGRTDIVPRTPPPGALSEMPSYMVQRPRLRYGTSVIQTSTLMLSRSLADSIRWDTTMTKHQDWDLVARAARDRDARFVWVPRPLTTLQQGTVGSVSARQDWRASAQWHARHVQHLTSRSSGDFAAALMLRAALAEGSCSGVLAAGRVLRHSRPHTAALVVGASGVLSRAFRAKPRAGERRGEIDN